MKSGNAAQRFLRRAFAAADQLLTFPREIDLLQRIRPLSGKNPLRSGQRHLMAQKRLAHPRGRVQRVAARQRSADMPRGHSVADCLRQGAHVLHIARPKS